MCSALIYQVFAAKIKMMLNSKYQVLWVIDFIANTLLVYIHSGKATIPEKYH